MKKIFGALLTTAAFFSVSNIADAQCLQNGIPCGQSTQSATGGPVPSSGTLVMGTDGTSSYPVLTDSSGKLVITVATLPTLPAGTNTIGSVANTAFGISGTLPAFAATPTFNVGTTNGLALDTTVGGLFKSGQSIGNTTFASTQSGTWNVGLSAGSNAIGTVGVTALPALPAGTNAIGSVTTQGAVTTAAPSYTNGSVANLSLTAAGALRVDTGGATQTVTGTVATTAADGSNVTLGSKTDAKCLSTDATACSNTGLLKGIIDRQQALVTAATTATPAGTNTIGNVYRATVFPETTTALAASAAFTGASHDSGIAGSAMEWGFFTCFVNTDKAGTLVLAGSNNNSTFYNVISQSITASTPITATSRVLFRYMRCAVTNSTTAQTTFVLNSQFGE